MLNTRIGILGGGQLARMLALDAYPLGLHPEILTPHADDPAAHVCGRTTLAAATDGRALRGFLESLDAVTFESEFVDLDALRPALPKSVYVFPSPDAIGAIQDRLTQKQLLDRFKIATSEWQPIASESDLSSATARFTSGFVLKARRFGYDGNGTFVVEAKGRPDPRWRKCLAHGLIAEAFVPFERELATSFVRSRAGDFRALPLVESVQVDARCFSVRGPVEHAGLPKLTRRFRQLMTDLDYVGILAVELFDVGGHLVVNELAPRVHNSAHYSQDALTCSQFAYHLRAGLGLSLPKVTLRAPGFAMVNLLGEGRAIQLNYDHEGRLHWYGKTENRPGRKLGHLNVFDRTGAAALKRALRWRKDISL